MTVCPKAGHDVCAAIPGIKNNSEAPPDRLGQLAGVAKSDDPDLGDGPGAAEVVADAIPAYCPQYSDQGG